MRLTHRWLTAAFVFLEAVTVAGAAMAAQAGWEEVVKAAEKEGEVTVYATNSVGDVREKLRRELTISLARKVCRAIFSSKGAFCSSPEICFANI